MNFSSLSGSIVIGETTNNFLALSKNRWQRFVEAIKVNFCTCGACIRSLHGKPGHRTVPMPLTGWDRLYAEHPYDTLHFLV